MAGPAYNPNHNPWAEGANNIGALLAMSPRLRAVQREQQGRQQLLEAQTQTQQAQGEHYRAQTGKVNAETDALHLEATDSADLEKSFGDLMESFQNKRDATPALRQVAGKLGHYLTRHPDKAVDALRSLASAGLVNQGGTNLSPAQLEQAAAMQDSNKAFATVTSGENSRAATAGRTNVGMDANRVRNDLGTESNRIRESLGTESNRIRENLGNAGIASRERVGMAGVNQRAVAKPSYDTVTEVLPKTEPTDQVTEVVPPVVNKWAGFDWLAKDTPGQYKTNTIPGHGALHITRKIPRGASIDAVARSGGITNLPPAIDVPSVSTPMPNPTTNAPAALPPVTRAPAPMPAPAAAPAKPDPAEILAQANDAISRGADPVKVRARLAQMGINVQ